MKVTSKMRGICHFSKSIFLFLYLLYLSKYIEMAKTLDFHHSKQDENRRKIATNCYCERGWRQRSKLRNNQEISRISWLLRDRCISLWRRCDARGGGFGRNGRFRRGTFRCGGGCPRRFIGWGRGWRFCWRRRRSGRRCGGWRWL